METIPGTRNRRRLVLACLVAAVNDMLDHREKWPAMRAAGRRFVEDVRNWKNSVANYRKVYDQLLGSRPA